MQGLVHLKLLKLMDGTCNMQKLRLDKSFAESETQEEMKVGKKLGVAWIAWRNSGHFNYGILRQI